MLETVSSKNGVLIRLTDERWAHITEEHCELAGLRLEILETVANPSRVLKVERVSSWLSGRSPETSTLWWFIVN